MREDREADLRSQAAEKEKTLEEASKSHAEVLELMAKRANDLEEEKEKEKSRADKAEQAVKILQQTLEMEKINEAKAKVVRNDLSSEVDTLKAEVKRLTDLRAEEQASLAQKIDDEIERATDKALYRVWSNNPGVLDLRFLRDELEPTLARWKLRLEEEAEITLSEAVGGSDDGGEAEEDSLKTARNRLTELRDIAHEIFQAAPPSEPEVPASSPIIQPAAKDVPSSGDDAQK